MTQGYLFLSRDLKSYSLLTGENVNIDGRILPSMFYDLLSLRIDNIYVWQGAAVFALIDNFANKQQLFNYADIATDKYGRRQKCNCEAISYKDGAGAYYQRKLWLKTIKAESSDRHKRLSATTFINFSNFFGGEDFTNVCKSFGVTLGNDCSALKDLIRCFNVFIKQITGLTLIKENGGINYWTIGGLSKAYYLELYKKYYSPDYKGNTLKLYQSEHLQDKKFEYDMRLAHLLTPGMLYYRDTQKHTNFLYKYDKNSLFPSVERDCPFLGVPRSCEEPSSADIKEGKFEYIYLYKNLHLRLKLGMPAIFKNPNKIYRGYNEDDVFLEEIAFYRNYHESLLLFYDIIDYEKVEFFKMRLSPDAAINEYVNTLYDYKVGCKKSKYDIRHYPLIKYLLNNLHGKLAQLTIVEDYDYNKNADGIINRRVKKLSDTWQQSHFDYLRGAWIYSTSQAEMLKDLYILGEYYRGKSQRLDDHIFYIDTDCMITDAEPEIMVNLFSISSFELGAYKIEYKYLEFQVYAPKTYAGLVNGKIQLTTAGMKKNEIIAYMYSQHISDNDCLNYLSSYPELPCTILKRTAVGCEYVTEWRPLGHGFNISDEEEGVLYDCDNFII